MYTLFIYVMIDWNIFYSFIKILKYQRKSSLVIEKLSQYKADFMAGCELASGWQDSSLCGDDVERLRLLWLGRKGKIPELFSSLRAVAKEDKARFGKELNDLKHFIESELLKLNALVEQRAVCDVISSQREDITLPVAAVSARGGGLHPISLISERLLAVFRSLGYIVHEGPELENDFYNFSALNVPKDHPARDMQDTFYVGDRGSVSSGVSPSWVLRTQTSNIQIHALKDQSPPLRIVSAGRVFRMDNDPTHSPMFHQIEGLVVDRDISMAHLRGTVKRFLSLLFGRDVQIRFRPSYFPFVEPGVEVDMAYDPSLLASPQKPQSIEKDYRGDMPSQNRTWLEVGGCGMVHPNLFENVGINSEDYSGFAFGFGLDRLAMLAYGLTDLRALFVGSKSFHNSFPVCVSSQTL